MVAARRLPGTFSELSPQVGRLAGCVVVLNGPRVVQLAGGFYTEHGTLPAGPAALEYELVRAVDVGPRHQRLIALSIYGYKPEIAADWRVVVGGRRRLDRAPSLSFGEVSLVQQLGAEPSAFRYSIVSCGIRWCSTSSRKDR